MYIAGVSSGEVQWEAVGAGGEVRAGSAARGHAGEYRCAADNGVGAPLVKRVNVTVHGEYRIAT